MEALPAIDASFTRVTGTRHEELVRMAPSLACLAGDHRILVIHPRTREIAEIEIPLPRSGSLGEVTTFARAVPLHNPRDASTATGFAFVTKSSTLTGLPQSSFAALGAPTYLVVLAFSNRDAAVVLKSSPAPMTLHCDVPGQLIVVHASCTADVLSVEEFLRADPARTPSSSLHGSVRIQTEQPILDVYQPSPDRWIVLCLGREGAGNVVRTYTRDLTSFSQVRPSLIYMSTHLRSLGKAIVSGCKTIAILPKENHEVTRITTADVFTLAELPVSPSFPHPLSDRQYGGDPSAGPVFVAIDGTRTASLRVRHEGPEPDTFAVAGDRTYPWVSAPAADGSEPSCAIVLKGADGVERACPVWVGGDGRLYVAMEQDRPPVAVC